MINDPNNDGLPLFAEERREQIVQLLDEKSKILVPELCEYFSVSPATIRSDLRDLESAGRLKRTHGGAIPAGKTTFEPDSSFKEIKNIEEKRLIAACAAQMVEDGDTIALDSGTTTLEIAKGIADRKDLTVVTNDFKIASFLELKSSANVILSGGSVRRGFHCLVGPMAIAAMSGLNVDMAFIGANAISLQKGCTVPSFDHAQIKSAMMEIASRTIILADSSKIGRVSFIRFANFDQIDALITDNQISQSVANSLKEAGDGLDIYIA